MKLEYLGRLLLGVEDTNEATNPRCWHLWLEGHWRNGSCLTLATLRELGLLTKCETSAILEVEEPKHG